MEPPLVGINKFNLFIDGDKLPETGERNIC